MNSKVELLNICIAVENTVSEIYESFAVKFPEQQVFWKGLAAEEKGHSRQFVVAISLKGAAALPSSMQFAQKALETVRRTKKEALENANLRLEDAFKIAISIEQTAVECFLEHMTSEEPDEALKRFYATLIDDGRHHAELLKKRLSGLGQS